MLTLDTVVLVIINLAQELAKDAKVLNRLSVDPAAVSSKVTHRLVAKYQEKTPNNILFRFDQSTSTNLIHILTSIV